MDQFLPMRLEQPDRLIHAMNEILSKNDKIANKPTGQEPANIRHIGTALGTMTHHDGKPTTVRIIVVTAEIKK